MYQPNIKQGNEEVVVTNCRKLINDNMMVFDNKLNEAIGNFYEMLSVETLDILFIASKFVCLIQN